MKKLVPDELWEIIQPLLPKHPPSPRGGHPRIDDRVALTGIMFILKTGIAWEDLPQEIGCSGMTCWRRLKEWNDAGVWVKLQQRILQKLEDAGTLDWRRAAIDASSVRAMHRGEKTGPNPTDRAKYGSKRHVLTDAQGAILSTSLTAANRHEATEATSLVKHRPRVRQRNSRKHRKPKSLLGDRAYDSEPYREWLRSNSIRPKIARRAQKGEPPTHGSGLGVKRWVVEHAHSLLNKFRRLRIRDDVRAEIYESFLLLGVAIINLSFL
jgi:transposase